MPGHKAYAAEVAAAGFDHVAGDVLDEAVNLPMGGKYNGEQQDGFIHGATRSEYNTEAIGLDESALSMLSSVPSL